MDEEAISSYFKQTMIENPGMSEAVAAIQTLIEFIESSQADTLTELDRTLKNATDVLKSSEKSMVTSIASGCQLFLLFISRTSKIEMKDLQEIKQVMVARGNQFLQKIASSRKKIARLCNPFISDGATILVHSRSRVVLEVLKEAAEAKKRFTVYVTESLPDRAGQQMYNDLKSLDIPTVVILDSAVGYIMEKVDMALVGAEGVVESGGIINKIGTFTIAMCAKEMNKPVYVVAESCKFTRMYPLNQRDVPDQFKFPTSDATEADHPSVDYTPPAYLTLLFTDLGVLTPSAVSDELIKLYV